MKIAKVELYHVQIPLEKTFYPTWIPGYPQTHNSFTLVRLETKCGIEGWSAGAAMGREREGLGDLIGGYLIGLDPEDIPTANQRLKEASYLGWRNYWIEPAFWDIVGKSKGKPVYELLGGSARPVETYISTGEMRDPAQRAEQLLEMAERGFKTAKLRVKNIELKDDIRHVETVASRVSGKLIMGVDANQGWLVTIMARMPAWTHERAYEFAVACARNNFRWLEEPLDSRDYDGLAALRAKKTGVRLAGAELNYGWDETKVMIEKGCLDAYQPDSTFCGISQAKRTLDACREKGLDFSPHTWTNGIGLIINMHLWLADAERNLPLEYPLEEPSWIPRWRDGIQESPILPDSEGRLAPPTEPGLGLRIDPAKLRRYGRRFFKMTELGLKFKVVREKGVSEAVKLAKQKKQLELES
ncbi:MAG: D-galactonate dehydratase [bacterium ADurb.Bin236]|nr:MAG: D-galactonate dehydratase [bacterium ADurb.Bin236]HPN95204.1 mandelate racemase/muconate lactonizing enzyme family protein [bacterium]